MRISHATAVAGIIGVLVGAGCAPQVSPTVSNELRTRDEASANATIDTSEWETESGLSGVSFSHPSELEYVTGGDIDTGSWSWLAENGDATYATFSIFTYAHFVCPETGECNLGTIVPGTVEQVLDQAVASFEADASYRATGDISVGNVSGKKFEATQANADGSVKTLVLFRSSTGVYQLVDSRSESAGDALFIAWLSTFDVQ
jgi:hypothetical protein